MKIVCFKCGIVQDKGLYCVNQDCYHPFSKGGWSIYDMEKIKKNLGFDKTKNGQSNTKDKYSNEKKTSHSKNSKREPNKNNHTSINQVEINYGKSLGLRGKVNMKQIHLAYRNKIKEYHPDKIATMAEELKELALKRTKEINEAYEYFKKKYGE